MAITPENWRAPELKAVLEQLAEEIGRKLGKTQAPVRVTTLGNTVGLPLFESLEVLGRETRCAGSTRACGVSAASRTRRRSAEPA